MSGYDAYFQKKKEILKKKSLKRKVHQFWVISMATALAAGGVWFLLGGDQQAAHILSKVEVSWLGEADAADAKDDTAPVVNSADSKQKTGEKVSPEAGPEAAETKSKKGQPKTWSDEEIALFTKLEDRKKQLDAREAQLAKLDEELQSQKLEIERRLASLEEVREKISSKLEDKVKVDQLKVESLVGMYAKMKPVQAAKVIEGINEDLAVEVLSKMKSTAAAEILNLMDPEKAKKLSERFAGFREPAAVMSN